MNRAKKSKRQEPEHPKRDRPKPSRPVPLERDLAAASAESQEPSPDSWVRGLLSLGVLFHLTAVSASFLSVIEPSETHFALLEVVEPYLRLTHFGADGRRVYLAHAEPLEQPHRLQLKYAGDDEWVTIQPEGIAGFAAADRYSRWVGSMAGIAEDDGAGLVAEMLIPEIEKLRKHQPTQKLQAVRIVRLPTELTTVADDALPPPYTASVVVGADQVRLVQVKDERLNARSLLESPPRKRARRDISDGGFENE